MGCRCNERRDAILRGVKGIASGDTVAAKREAAFIVQSSAQDAASALRRAASIAKQRLGSRK